MSNRKIFEPGDFERLISAIKYNTYYSFDYEGLTQVAISCAQSKLEKLIAGWQVVYGNVEFDFWNEERTAPNNDQWQHTHTARLAFVEPIAECEHKNVDVHTLGEVAGRCLDCGIELVAEWKAK